ncbi:hypothetical protein [Clostridium saccharobutylicum]|nr:hypothetical protein [Clostridium saccharobutylicum]AQR89364.1 hypothetical protein CLOSC_10650 [Clostridium saccharobutylicum]AQR99265.1 hypothetical protein CSACC_10720 [Clostridium saccharobutylicum]AQS08998.1 hypothetical protein CLOBY_11190 [Clostridium saccharobutylicum]AQS13253.1 hypothetical protein CLOSACC_10720 [Clostridium saccharobutylicum]MBA2904560.1 hypothetical protein [Clostridium saccharobutylicum]
MKNILKNYVFRKILPGCLMIIIVVMGLIKVDVINTNALSPLGNTNENYKIVSEEFGEDFSNFIKDNSFLKIYKEDGDDILIRLGNSDFRITNQSNFLKKIQGVFNNISHGINGAKETIDKIL